MAGPSATTSVRIEKQFTGENINVWGDHLNVNFDLLDSAIAGFATVALTSTPYQLTSTNYAADQARSAMLKFTGAVGPWTVQIPGVSKSYLIWNATTGTVTITTGSGSTVSIDTGDILAVFSDGTNVKTLSYGGLSIKDYIAAQVIAAAGSVPAVTGNAGKFVYTDGVSAYWKTPLTTDLGDYATRIVGLQVAMAVAL